MDSGPDNNKTSEHLPGWMIAGRYELVGKLGEGGMGAVFKVRDHKVGRRLIALKRILQLNEHAHERFEREIDSAANLNHRNICKVYDRGDDEHGPFFTMELLTGGSLRERVERDGPLPEDAFIDLARQLVQALRYAHRKSVQHRDIKPGNVLFDEDGDPKLADFGLARVGPSTGLSVTSYGLGTPGYSAPEQLRDSKSADHRADIYGLGATLYYALTGKSPIGVIEPADIPSTWQAMILKCIKEDPAERYFDAEEILKSIENPPVGARQAASGHCTVCGVDNAAGSSFCRQCGAGLNEPCPRCGAANRAGEKICGGCRVDITKRRASDKWLQEARDHAARRDYRRAAKAAEEASRHEPDRDETKVVLADAREMMQQVETLGSSAATLESDGQYRDAEQAWKQLLDLHPEHREASEAVERIRGRILDDQFHEKAKQFEAAIDKRDLALATQMLQQLRAIPAPAADLNLSHTEQTLETLRRALILHHKDGFEDALTRRGRRRARAAIGALSDLHVDQAEITTLLDRLKAAERWWRRRRLARRTFGTFVTLVLLAGGYLLGADKYNEILADEAAEALGRAEDPVLERMLPTWPRDLSIVLAEKIDLCRTLDGHYGGDGWRQHIEPVELFGIDHTDDELVAAYNWLVLAHIAASARSGADDDINTARNLVRNIALAEPGEATTPFGRRQDALGRILTGWYDGALDLDVFADTEFAGDPELEFVALQGERISAPETDCHTISNLRRLMTRLNRGEAVPDQVRAHNDRVLDAVVRSVAEPRSSHVKDLLGHICVDPDDAAGARDIAAAFERLVDDLIKQAMRDTRGRSNVAWLLVAMDRGMPSPPPQLSSTLVRLATDWNAEVFPAIEVAFATGGDAVAQALSQLRELSEFWPYLGEATAMSLRERERSLREIHELWTGGPLSVTPLCRLDGDTTIDDLWTEFVDDTEQQVMDAFYQRHDAEKARRLADLLGDLDHETDGLGDLESRFVIREVLDQLAGQVPAGTGQQLVQRIFEADTDGAATRQLATDVVIAAIEAGVFDAAVRLVEMSDTPDLDKVARNLDQIHDLNAATLQALERRLLDDAAFPEAGRRVRGEVAQRLAECFPEAIYLESPGQLSLGSAYEVSTVRVQIDDTQHFELEPLPDGHNVFRVPFLESGRVVLSLADAFGVESTRPLVVVHGQVENPADVTLSTPRVIAGTPAILVIRPQLAFDRVTVDDVAMTDQLVAGDDHWTLALPTSLAANRPAEDLQFMVQLVTPEGVQKLKIPVTVVAQAVLDAEEALEFGQYQAVFDRLDAFTRTDHHGVRQLVHEASVGWLEQLRAMGMRTWDDADRLVGECEQFLGQVGRDLQQDAGVIRDRAWIRRIDLTMQWDSVAALMQDAAFLDGLKGFRDPRQKKMIAWFGGARKWAEPIVMHMRRLNGDWSTTRDLNADTYPSLLVHRATDLEFIYVPTGSFWIGGDSKAPQERPHRHVSVTGFYLSTTECTNAAWATSATGSGGDTTSASDDRYPVTGVSFTQSVAWCRELGLDLPTEAQWEFAAGGPGSLQYPWGSGKCRPNVKRTFRASVPAETGSHECDRSWYGLMDMAGNVREWCYPVSNATYRILNSGAVDPPARPDGAVQRGASFQDPKNQGRTHARLFSPGTPGEADTGAADDAVGFRPVLSRESRPPLDDEPDVVEVPTD
jgi:serine/threonine protein kinase